MSLQGPGGRRPAGSAGPTGFDASQAREICYAAGVLADVAEREGDSQDMVDENSLLVQVTEGHGAPADNLSNTRITAIGRLLQADVTPNRIAAAKALVALYDREYPGRPDRRVDEARAFIH